MLGDFRDIYWTHMDPQESENTFEIQVPIIRTRNLPVPSCQGLTRSEVQKCHHGMASILKTSTELYLGKAIIQYM